MKLETHNLIRWMFIVTLVSTYWFNSWVSVAVFVVTAIVFLVSEFKLIEARSDLQFKIVDDQGREIKELRDKLSSIALKMGLGGSK